MLLCLGAAPLALVVSAVVAACSPASTPTRWTDAGPVAAGLSCNPLAKEWDCLYPWPSDFFLKPDKSMPNGVRVEVPGEALPHYDAPGGSSEPVDFFPLHPSDGFSVLPQIAVRIPGSVDPSGLVSVWKELAPSLTPASRTLLIDAETGALVLHFAEVDPRPSHLDDRALLIRPLVRLKNGHRYIVALHGLEHADGSKVTAPKMFAHLRDEQPSGDYETRMQRYYDARIFPAIQQAGVKRADLQLAWDFTTESEAATTGDMLSIRSQLLALYARQPPTMKVDAVVAGARLADADGHIGREIKATMHVPLFLESGDPGALIHRGPDGKPAQNGYLDAPFTIRIPNSVLSGAKAGRLVQYGHGFFGTQAEVDGTYPSRFADQTGSILIAADWKGMSSPDVPQLFGDLLSDPDHAPAIVDGVHQAMVDFISLTYLAKGALLAEPALQDASGQPLYDPAHVYYYGISLGSILGATYLALSPHLDRAALSVGGCGFGLLMSRASPFGPFLGIIEQAVGTKADALKTELLFQTSLDRIDPVSYAPHLLAQTYAGSPAARKILFQIGVSDPEVPNMAEHVLMRTLGVPLLQPGPREVFGLAGVKAPVDGSALVEWDFGLAPPDVLAEPAAIDPALNPHEQVRRQPAAIEMIDHFLTPGGKIEDSCEGVCTGTKVDLPDDPAP